MIEVAEGAFILLRLHMALFGHGYIISWEQYPFHNKSDRLTSHIWTLKKMGGEKYEIGGGGGGGNFGTLSIHTPHFVPSLSTLLYWSKISAIP